MMTDSAETEAPTGSRRRRSRAQAVDQHAVDAGINLWEPSSQA